MHEYHLTCTLPGQLYKSCPESRYRHAYLAKGRGVCELSSGMISECQVQEFRLLFEDTVKSQHY